MKPEDICPAHDSLPEMPATPHSAPIWLASVYRCDSPQQAAALLSRSEPGYVYQRDGHPNADILAEKIARLHGAERAMITSCGMSALAVLVLSQLGRGDHLVVSHQLYGRSLELLRGQTPRLGVTCEAIDTCDLAAVKSALRDSTKLLVAETISNPLLRVADIAALAKLAHGRGAKLVIDNTFASPIICRPLEHGADLVIESLSKSMSGHSDVMLGAICGRAADWEHVPAMVSIWGLASSPFDCWLANRGLATLHLRAKAASSNALAVAGFLLQQKPAVSNVRYPGLATHVDHATARAQFGDHCGAMVTFDLAGGLPAAEQFIAAIADDIPFCPSLGEVSTTLSHPASTSHRALSAEEQVELGINGGTIRLSVGTESPEHIISALKRGLSPF
jgi:cystathionine beta-lyase/cystathionine gamma-synthase